MEVTINKLFSISDDFESNARKLNGYLNTIMSVRNSLSSEVARNNGIDETLQSIINELESKKQMIYDLGRGLDSIANLYRSCENRINDFYNVTFGLTDEVDKKPWYKSNIFKIIAGTTIIVGLGVAAIAGAPAFIAAAAVGAAVVGAAGAIAGGIISYNNGGNVIDGIANGLLLGSVGGAAVGALGYAAVTYLASAAATNGGAAAAGKYIAKKIGSRMITELGESILEEGVNVGKSIIEEKDLSISDIGRNIINGYGISMLFSFMPNGFDKILNKGFGKISHIVNNAVIEGIEKVSKKIGKESIEEVTEKLGKEGIEKATQQLGKELVEDGAEKVGKESVEKATQQIGKEIAEDGAEKTVKNAVEGGSNSRVIPGTDGVVTGGDSTKLGKNMMESMGQKRGTKWSGYQAQHVIPAEMIDHPVLNKIGMNLDDASNGIFLRIPADDISSMSRHRGYHSTYNEFVKLKLDEIDINQSSHILQNQVYDLQQNLKKLQQSGLPLYPNQGASVDLWERSLERIR